MAKKFESVNVPVTLEEKLKMTEIQLDAKRKGLKKPTFAEMVINGTLLKIRKELDAESS